MKHGLKVSGICSFLLLICFMGQAQIIQDSLTYENFGKVYIYKPTATPTEVVMFVSGDAGWKYGVIDMAKILARQGALVMGINILHYRQTMQKDPAKCHYASGDFEALDEFVQKKYNLPHFYTPLLAGFSSGATLIYGVMAQAPAGTYKGGIALGFCPDLNISNPLCEGSGLHATRRADGRYNLLPRPHLSSPFVALIGTQDKVCRLETTQRFMNDLDHGKIYVLPEAGHGFTKPKSWLPQFLEGYQYITTQYHIPEAAPPTGTSLQDLPLIEIPATHAQDDMPMVVCISGDGGWKGFINNIMQKLADQGMPVIGLDALRYFWNEKSPEKTTQDIVNMIQQYAAQWHKSRVILLGYSFGANVVPFVVNRMPQEIRDKLMLAALLSPDQYADFEFHFSSWWDKSKSQDYQVVPEIGNMKGMPVVIIYGSEENNPVVATLPKGIARFVEVPGDHHYNYNVNAVTQPILDALKQVGQ